MVHPLYLRFLIDVHHLVCFLKMICYTHLHKIQSTINMINMGQFIRTNEYQMNTY